MDRERNLTVKYSVCMTSFNEVDTVADSLNSLLRQLNEDYEVVVVDNFSTDGTYERLREFEDSRRIKVVQRRCTRGIGRQIAFENSSGRYILANLDVDDIFLPVLGSVIAEYHKRAEGKLVAVFNSDLPSGSPFGWVQNVTIGPRELIASIGGWRDLNFFEDWDIWSRASAVHQYRWTSFGFASNVTRQSELEKASTRLSYRYVRYRERYRLGLGIFVPGEEVSLSQRFVAIAAWISAHYRGILVGQNPKLNPHDSGLFIDLRNGGRPGA